MNRLDGTRFCFWHPSTWVAQATASCRYRIGNFAEHLRGVTAVSAAQLPAAALRGKDVLRVLRPCVGPNLARVLDRYRQGGLYLVGDFDDLLFDGAPEEFPQLARRPHDVAVNERRLRLYREGLACFDAFTVATQPLAERLRTLRPDAPIAVVPNGLSSRWLRQAELTGRRWSAGDPRVIRYFAGSPSHDRDFEVVRPALARFLRDVPDVRFEAVGPLEWSVAGFPPERVSRHRAVPFQHLGDLLASTWVSLAPLADNGFNRCKSAIKVLEAAAVGCPTIATPTWDVERHAAGVSPARSEEDWYQALRRLLDDDVRLSQGNAARAHLADHGMASLHAGTLCHALEDPR